ncbi:Type IV fimbrial biogenesis protein PilW [Pseudomonas chlororaphis subsp. aurantiaca]|uniref:PilW family protein n=1 Tax=Pseudomonas chlororaphis TaxID=587753 RepID=UPI000F55C45E|nr:prepilin-type N-terminal cleavage/methylation domain-containing protein [Pseudomonas chlororaphis]AZD38234.1 Type IV fimbrial biogenesis protein PilW [Pseudomonas chlororaphis subsp. aurantiaca]AZD44575.1 Type IV fimbrial biogenesis protein PilW [Pseudomonas chlororaphis subsp. aurantiaca]AZD81948.1 Type IV fimbrial biogenesis protein PilW [Pseudomonas chlororaphis subsp. aurantiaca]QQX58118.1 prepilin-type N-terminal cleavage/methylation domain-containing protein [Pseudomonas chlororaphis s
MRRGNSGFGLIEMLVALALSLIVALGVTQIFISAKNTYLSQSASAGLQEDARFVLSKMIQEIRMVGMFGCLQSIADSSTASDFAGHAQTPIRWDNANHRLTLVTADIGDSGGAPTWTVLSDCRNSATAYTGARKAPTGQQAFAVRRLVYSLKNDQLLMGTGTGSSQAVLVNNVSAFDVSFGIASTATDIAASRYSRDPGDPARIRSVRLSLTLSDPQARVRPQTFNVVAALRNRLL